jgi:excisionase family DNA binding protein
MQTNSLNDLITQAEAARLRGVSREAIYGLVARRKLSVVEIGGQRFVRRSEVESYTPEVGGRPPTKSNDNEASRKRGKSK